MAHFTKLGTPLHSVQRYPTTQHQKDRFRNLGWKSARARNLWELWSAPDFIDDAERRSLDRIEPFDEWEEFALFGCHYVLVIASTADKPHEQENNATETGRGRPQDAASSSANALYSEYPRVGGCNRFASAISIVSSSKSSSTVFGIYGGVGSTTRVSSIDVYSIGDATALKSNVYSSAPTPSARMCHTTTDVGAVGTLLVGGRLSPDNALGDCWLYHKYLDVWERIDDLPSPRFRHAAVSLGGGHVLVTPGRADSVEVAGNFWVWHRENGWRECQVASSDFVPTFGSVAFGLGKGSRDTEPRYGVLAGGLSPTGTVEMSTWKWTVVGLDTRVSFMQPIYMRRWLTRVETDDSVDAWSKQYHNLPFDAVRSQCYQR